MAKNEYGVKLDIFKITHVGSKHCYWQVILHPKKFLKVCMYPSWKIPPKLREDNEICHRLRTCVKLHIEQAQEVKFQDSERDHRTCGN